MNKIKIINVVIKNFFVSRENVLFRRKQNNEKKQIFKIIPETKKYLKVNILRKK
jgi:hypothetical protein